MNKNNSVSLYFPQDVDVAEVMDNCRYEAKELGFINQRGPLVGEGNVAGLLSAIANRDVIVIDVSDLPDDVVDFFTDMPTIFQDDDAQELVNRLGRAL